MNSSIEQQGKEQDDEQEDDEHKGDAVAKQEGRTKWREMGVERSPMKRDRSLKPKRGQRITPRQMQHEQGYLDFSRHKQQKT
jgi:hypothetical protein